MARPDVSVVVLSYNARPHLERCLAALAAGDHELVVVDNASTDGSGELVRTHFPAASLLEFDRNRGFGAANNAGMCAASGRYYLLVNADAWPVGDAVAELVRYADANPAVGAAGPCLRNVDGSLQRSVRGFPTAWRIATEYFFLRKLAPRTRLLNSFYAGDFAHDVEREADWLKAAVLLLRREAIDEVGGFDESFFLFSEEVDLCKRLHEAGWAVRFWRRAEFIHVGGASTAPQWGSMYRELLRSHLRYFAKHQGLGSAERIRRLLLVALRLRSWVFRGERARLYADARAWLSSRSAAELLGSE